MPEFPKRTHALDSPLSRGRLTVQLLLVLAACASVQGWLVAHARTISRDGVGYLKVARACTDGVACAAQASPLHVGYPATLAAARWAMVRAGGSSGRDGWELAGQLVSLLAALGAAAALWALAGLTLGWRVAWTAPLLFGVTKRWAAEGADVVTEPLAILAATVAAAAAVAVSLRLRRAPDRRVRPGTLALAALAGLGVGAGYLVRPEMLLVGPLAAGLWLFGLLAPPRRWRSALACVAVMAAAALACALPYMITIGGLTNKHDWQELLSHAASGSSPLLAIGSLGFLGTNRFGGIPGVLIAKFTEAIHPVLGAALLIWLVTYVGARLPRPRLPAGILRTPRWQLGFLVVGWAVLFVPFLVGRAEQLDRLSARYLFFQAVLAVPFAAAGVWTLAAWLRVLAGRLKWPAWIRRHALPLVALPMAVVLAWDALEPLHASWVHYRRAGEHLAATAGPDERVVVTDVLVLHYAERRGPRVVAGNFTSERLALWSMQGDWLVITEKDMEKFEPRPRTGWLAGIFSPPVFEEVAAFPQPGKKRDPDVARVYRIHHAALRERLAERRAR